MSSTLLQAHRLTRRFGDFEALKPVDFSLSAGDLVVVVGPNGAGKTTLLLCLSGLMQPTGGTVTIEGFDLYRDEVEARRRLAYVPDVPVFYPELTAWEHLYFMAMAHHAGDGFERRAEELLRSLQLWEARDLFPHAFSRGMRLKLGLALALIRPFQVLVMDEPSSALDAGSLDELEAIIIRLRAQGHAVLLTTHNAAFAERLPAKSWRLVDGTLHVE